MPLPPNESDFPMPKRLVAGRHYVWLPNELLSIWQDRGYEFANEHTTSEGVRYNLLFKGAPERMLSPDNLQPTIEVHYPDSWAAVPEVASVTVPGDLVDISEEGGQIRDPDEEEPPTPPQEEREFVL